MSAFDTSFNVTLGKEVFSIILAIGGCYMDGSYAIRAICDDGSLFGVLTVCVPGSNLNPGEVLVKTWSENEPWAHIALSHGDLVDTGRRVKTGYVEAQVWKWK